MQMTDEGDDVASPNVVVVELPLDADRTASRREADRTDGRQSVVPSRDALDRRLAAGSPGAAGCRLEQEARFIEKHDGRAATTGLFLIRGQSSVRHRAIAASLRCEARRCGFYCVKPTACSNRPTWSGWYVTPNSRRITSATRLQVHQSVVKPTESGPARTISAKRRSADVNAKGRPGIGLDLSAASPPACQARLQRLTLDTSAPTRFATSVRLFRSARRATARRRRASNSAALPLGLMPQHTHASDPTVHSICRGQ